MDAQIADSACTATAYLCGVKNNEATIGVTAAVPRLDCVASLRPEHRVDSIAAWALQDGRDAGNNHLPLLSYRSYKKWATGLLAVSLQ